MKAQSVTHCVSMFLLRKSQRAPTQEIKAPVDDGIINVVIFGETGVGKSSLVNLIIGKYVAKTSDSAEGCTFEATYYDVAIDSRRIRLFDTAGLSEPCLNWDGYLLAVKKAERLVSILDNYGGVDLLIFCMRGGRITASAQQNYRMFVEILCDKKIPVAVVVTHLEHEERMEDWWDRNEKHFETYGISVYDHACITTIRKPNSRHHDYSRDAVIRLLWNCTSLPCRMKKSQEELWFVQLLEGMWRYLLPRAARPGVKELTRKLVKRCGFSKDDANRIARRLKDMEDDTIKD